MSEAPPSLALLASLLKRAFPAGVSEVERVTEGDSTWVYRVFYGKDTFYLRVLPEVGASFAPEVAAHTQARKLGVKMPEVIWYEYHCEPLGRSAMITSEIPGRPLSQSTELDQRTLDRILIEAGKDLAHINSISVEGFGWISRDSVDMRLRAPSPDYRSFALEHWEADLAYLSTSETISSSEVERLRQTRVRHDAWIQTSDSVLAHDDFDATAIYQCGGRYTGIIDFGEMRGADHWYDLGYVHMRDGEYLPKPFIPPLARGYSEVKALPGGSERRIRFASVLINVRALSRSLQKRPHNRFTQHQVAVLRADLAALAD